MVPKQFQIRQVHSRNDLGEFRGQLEGHGGCQSESHRSLRPRNDDSAQESRMEKDPRCRIETLLRSGLNLPTNLYFKLYHLIQNLNFSPCLI